MNWDRIAGSWKEYRGKARSKWAELPDEDYERISGRREALIGALQRRYGISVDEAERQIEDWERTL